MNATATETQPSMISVSKTLLVCMAIVAGLMLAGCDFQTKSAKRHDSLRFPLPESGHCVLRTVNGKIVCKAGDVSEIQIEVDFTARGRTVEDAESNLELVSFEPKQRDGQTEYTIAVPSGVNASASIEVTLPSSMRLDLHSCNGPIETDGMQSGVLARTTNGPIRIADAGGKIDAETSNGKLTVQGDQLDQLSAHTSNGPVNLEGSLKTGTHQLHTSNGPVTVQLNCSASVCAFTSNGQISVDGKPTRSGQLVTLGSGHDVAELSITTSNGPVKVAHIKAPATTKTPATETVANEASQI